MDSSIFRVRSMRDGDISQVLEIDLSAFPTQWPHPTHSSYHHELRNKLAHYIVLYQDDAKPESAPIRNKLVFTKVLSYIKRLFDHDHYPRTEEPLTRELLVGMAGIWMMVDEAHIVTIALRKAYLRMGLGEFLLISIIDMALALRARIVTLEVRVSNTVAQALYSKYGFYTAGTRRKYYSDNGEDALIMSTRDITSPEYQDAFRRLKDKHGKRWSRHYAPSI